MRSDHETFRHKSYRAIPSDDLERLRAGVPQNTLEAFDRLPPLPNYHTPKARALLDQARLKTLLECPDPVAEVLSGSFRG